jgi:hypothetical protein
MTLKVSILAFTFACILVLTGCSTEDSRIVNKPFEELAWVERTRSPIAFAMADRHYRFTRVYKRAFDKAADAFDKAKADIEAGKSNDIGILFHLQELYIGYRDNLAANLKAVLFFKPDHRRALYELISLLEERWYAGSEEMNPFTELADLKELERILRQASDFFGRDYEVNYKLGAVIYRQGVILSELKEKGVADEDVSPEERFKDAQVFLRKCIAVRSTYAEAYQLLALCLEREERDKEAYKFWKLITVIEQAYKREQPDEIPPELVEVYSMAAERVEKYEREYGPQ